MKVDITDGGMVFKPFEIVIAVESLQEVNMLRFFAQQNITVPNALVNDIVESNHMPFNQLKLKKFVQDFQQCIFDAIKRQETKS